MRQWVLQVVLVLSVGLSAGTAAATMYLHRNFDQVLEGSELIVKGTVIQNLDTGGYRRSCAFQVDEVLSGTLSGYTLQVNREYIRLVLPRENYRTSETLVFCLSRPEKTYRVWPTYSADLPQYEIVGADAEGEFPIVNGEVWVRDIRSQQAEPVRYAGENLRVRQIPYEEFKKLVNQRVSGRNPQAK